LREFNERNGGIATSYVIKQGYEHLTVDAVLRKLIPEDDVTEIPSSFEQVGHIAHLNLRDEALPYKLLVGKVSELASKKLPATTTLCASQLHWILALCHCSCGFYFSHIYLCHIFITVKLHIAE
jgi:hypothetical protein